MQGYKHLLILLIFIPRLLFAQGGKHVPEPKAKEIFNKGLRSYYKKDYEQAIKYCKKAEELDNLYEDPYKLVGSIYSLQNKYEEEKSEYILLLKLDTCNLMCLVNLGTITFKHNEFKEAMAYYKRYLAAVKGRDDLVKLITARIKTIDGILKFQTHPVEFNPVNAGSGVNTEMNEYFPTLTVDGEYLYFTRKKKYIPEDNVDNMMSVFPQTFNEDIMVSHKVDGQWLKAEDAPGVNSRQNEGAPCISPDGTIMLFTSCNHPDPREGMRDNCDIYISYFKDGSWTNPIPIDEPLNTRYFESQPSISFDNRTIYFSSNRPGGFGGTDIYMVRMNDDGSLSQAVNLGPHVNSSEDEQAPFIHPDDMTLYFCSRGHDGMGQNDIFYARKSEKGTFDSAINIGYPINTTGDEPGMVVDGSGQYGYYASSGNKTLGGLDIFYFKMPETAKPQTVNYLKGKVFDAESKLPLAATFELVDILTGQSTIKKILLKDGKFLVPLPAGRDYMVNVSAQGYLFYSDNIPLKNHNSTQPFIKDIPLPPLKVGEKIILKNIFFETDKFDLLDASHNELDRLITLLKANPTLRIEISGHTDNSGSAEHNKELSMKRAQGVRIYLVNKGKIAADRLQAIGYGDSQPAAANDTPENMALNRRTEIKIIQ